MMAVVCKECRNCDWFWEDRDPDKECLGEEQPCEKYKPLKFICLKVGINNTPELKIENRRWIVEGTTTY